MLVSLIAVSAYAQMQSGNIYGKVQAKDGSVLPGVTVTLTGVGAPQTFVTDATGAFRFLNLSPGAYTLKAELAGFGTATRQGISVSIARNADVTMTLNPAAAESITVTAEAPLLDTRKSGTGVNVSNVELQNVPTGRDPWVIMQQTPGVLMDRINVGGSESGQQSGYVSKGADSTQSSWNVDGVNITDVGALGSTPTYYDFDSFEEMQITTGGSDPRIMTPGVQMNFVTKRGTNDFKGSARWFQTEDSWQADPSIPSEAQSYLSRVNQITSIEDRGIEFGGPIIKDRLWFWGALARQNVDLLAATLTTTGARAADKTLLSNQNIKINAQLFPSNSLVLTDSYGNKEKFGRNVSPTRPPETAFNQTDVYSGGGKGNLANPTMWKVEDTQIIGSSLYLTGLYSQVQGGFHLVGDAGQGCNTVACTTAGPVTYQDPDGVYHRNYYAYESVRPQKQARIDGSKFLDIGSTNHELKFGYGYRKADVSSLTAWAGNQIVWMFDDTNGAVTLTRNPETNFKYSVDYQDLYLADTILLGNLTIQGGLRYDTQKGHVDGGSLAGNPLVPEFIPPVSWNAISGLKWNNISPRVGLTYALGEQKKSLIRASYNRYAGQLGGSDVYLPSPGYYNYEYFYFTDLNHDKVAQRNELDLASGPQFGVGIDPSNPSKPQQYYRWSSDFKAPTTDEFIVGFEHELMPNLTIGADGTWRKMKDFSWTVGEHTQGKGDVYGPNDFVLSSTPATCTPSGAVTCAPFNTVVTAPYYKLKPGVSAPTFYVIENRPDYSQTYKSLDLFVTKRLSSRWMLRGNVTLQDWTQSVGARAIVDPTQARGATGCTTCNGSDVIIGAGSGSGAKGGVYMNSKWAYNLAGTYQIPVIETNFGFNLTGRQGYPIPYVMRIAGSNGQGGNYHYVLVNSDVAAYRHPNLTELDLRLAKDLRLGRYGLTLSADGFNVLNKQTVLQRDVTRITLSSSNHITELQSPRVFRLGARITF